MTRDRPAPRFLPALACLVAPVWLVAANRSALVAASAAALRELVRGEPGGDHPIGVSPGAEQRPRQPGQGPG
ncbi:hypothetical protein [Saccharothrix xinjiangensis]|uniref:Uncharacterized protein n=1 Tax=Saccharothrix xinjiangensis TaxID=204798 RepID=A0ABV9Y1B5_9PSEU